MIDDRSVVDLSWDVDRDAIMRRRWWGRLRRRDPSSGVWSRWGSDWIRAQMEEKTQIRWRRRLSHSDQMEENWRRWKIGTGLGQLGLALARRSSIFRSRIRKWKWIDYLDSRERENRDHLTLSRTRATRWHAAPHARESWGGFGRCSGGSVSKFLKPTRTAKTDFV